MKRWEVNYNEVRKRNETRYVIKKKGKNEWWDDYVSNFTEFARNWSTYSKAEIISVKKRFESLGVPFEMEAEVRTKNSEKNRILRNRKRQEEREKGIKRVEYRLNDSQKKIVDVFVKSLTSWFV